MLLAAACPAAAGAHAPPEATSAAHAKKCGLMAKGKKTYRVRGVAVRCKFARRWTKRYLRRGREARGFDCFSSNAPDVPFYCKKGDKSYYPERL